MSWSVFMKGLSHRAFAHAEPLANVASAVALDRYRLDDRTLALGQGPQHLPGIGRCALLHRLKGGQALGIVGNIEMLAKAAAPQMVDHLVMDDRAQPGLERLAVVPGVALQMHGQQRILHDILTVFRAPSGPRQSPARHDA